MKRDKRDFYNISGCADSTAYEAMKNVDIETSVNANRVVKEIKALLAQSGFVLINHIEIKDVKSGMIFK